jgi:hypothetical protein
MRKSFFFVAKVGHSFLPMPTETWLVELKQKIDLQLNAKN